MINKKLLTIVLLTVMGIQAVDKTLLSLSVGGIILNLDCEVPLDDSKKETPSSVVQSQVAEAVEAFKVPTNDVTGYQLKKEALADAIKSLTALKAMQAAEHKAKRSMQPYFDKGSANQKVQRQNWKQSGRLTGPLRTAQVKEYIPRRTGKGARAKLAKAERNSDKGRS